METLIYLTILCLLWLVSSKSWRRKLVQPLIAVAAAIIIVPSPLFTSLLAWGLTTQVPSDSGKHVDAIVVLGRGSNLRPDRIAEVWHLWKAQRAPHVFASGMMDAIPIVEELQKIGIPTSSLTGEECSRSTEENAVFSRVLLNSQKVRNILLVTDSPHLWRAFLIFQRTGFNVTPHAVPLSAQALTQTEWFSTVAREYLGIVTYALTGKLNRQPPEEINHLSTEAQQRISAWNCKIPRSKPDS